MAIGTRLKRAGMHWTVQGANAIIALRCCKLSGRFEDSGSAARIGLPPDSHTETLDILVPGIIPT